MLQCHVKNCSTSDNYPLAIQDADLQVIEADFNDVFMTKMIARLDWKALVQTALSVGFIIFFCVCTEPIS